MSYCLQPHGLFVTPQTIQSISFSRPAFSKPTGMGSLSLLQGIFPTWGWNPGLPNCRWMLYQLSHTGSPRILEWVAYPFSRGIFPTQELNQALLHCRWILYQLSYQGSPHICLLRCYQKKQYYKDRNFDFFQKGSSHERCKAFSVFAIELIKTLLKYLLLTFSFRGP